MVSWFRHGMHCNSVGGGMTHTLRIYNRRHRYRFFYHPWKQICMGHCSRCKEQFRAEIRRRHNMIRQIAVSEVNSYIGQEKEQSK
jgi:hypothetical protein